LIQELDANVSSSGVLTMRPLAFEFPNDRRCRGINDQYMFGPRYLVAPVTTQGATTRKLYFPIGSEWKDFFSGKVTSGGQWLTVEAPLDVIPAFERQ
jgi:alpha-D-xyloside xylohydrolase